MCSSLGEAEVQSWRVKQQTYWGQLLERINESLWYATQVDESTDIDHKAILLVLGWAIYFQEDEQEDV